MAGTVKSLAEMVVVELVSPVCLVEENAGVEVAGTKLVYSCGCGVNEGCCCDIVVIMELVVLLDGGILENGICVCSVVGAGGGTWRGFCEERREWWEGVDLCRAVGSYEGMMGGEGWESFGRFGGISVCLLAAAPSGRCVSVCVCGVCDVCGYVCVCMWCVRCVWVCVCVYVVCAMCVGMCVCVCGVCDVCGYVCVCMWCVRCVWVCVCVFSNAKSVTRETQLP